jgi:hypothetical protein
MLSPVSGDEVGTARSVKEITDRATSGASRGSVPWDDPRGFALNPKSLR